MEFNPVWSPSPSTSFTSWDSDEGDEDYLPSSPEASGSTHQLPDPHPLISHGDLTVERGDHGSNSSAPSSFLRFPSQSPSDSSDFEIIPSPLRNSSSPRAHSSSRPHHISQHLNTMDVDPGPSSQPEVAAADPAPRLTGRARRAQRHQAFLATGRPTGTIDLTRAEDSDGDEPVVTGSSRGSRPGAAVNIANFVPLPPERRDASLMRMGSLEVVEIPAQYRRNQNGRRGGNGNQQGVIVTAGAQAPGQAEFQQEMRNLDRALGERRADINDLVAADMEDDRRRAVLSPPAQDPPAAAAAPGRRQNGRRVPIGLGGAISRNGQRRIYHYDEGWRRRDRPRHALPERPPDPRFPAYRPARSGRMYNGPMNQRQPPVQIPISARRQRHLDRLAARAARRQIAQEAMAQALQNAAANRVRAAPAARGIAGRAGAMGQAIFQPLMGALGGLRRAVAGGGGGVPDDAPPPPVQGPGLAELMAMDDNLGGAPNQALAQAFMQNQARQLAAWQAGNPRGRGGEIAAQPVIPGQIPMPIFNPPRPSFTNHFGYGVDAEQPIEVDIVNPLNGHGVGAGPLTSKPHFGCARCSGPLLISGAQQDDGDKVWGLKCGHVIDGRCLEDLYKPPPPPVDPNAPPQKKQRWPKRNQPYDKHEWGCPVDGCDQNFISCKKVTGWVQKPGHGAILLYV